MLILVSPAKTLNYESPPRFPDNTQPEFLDDSRELIQQLRQLTPVKVGKLMNISAKLADLNVQRYQQWREPFTPERAKQAVYAFQGDVYVGLQADSMGKRDLNFAQKHLRILSGLYGLLKPLDLMLPYRLEMGTRFATNRGQNLYHFWGDKITDAINLELDNRRKPFIVNLASNEYFKVVNARRLNYPLISPIFRDKKNGEYKLISFFAKKARGMMARYIIDNRITRREDLLDFDTAGYTYNKKFSIAAGEPVFTRDKPQASPS